MGVKILNNLCICCSNCIDECPVEAIVDDMDNPVSNEAYYVYEDKCVECVGYNSKPACAMACPSNGCIVWNEEGVHPKRKKNEQVIG